MSRTAPEPWIRRAYERLRYVPVIGYLLRLFRALVRLPESESYHAARLEQQERRIDDLEARLAAAEANWAEAAEGARRRLDGVETRLEELSTKQRADEEAGEERISALEERFERWSETAQEDLDHLGDARYVAFEDRFRGDRADVKHRQEPYVAKIEATPPEIAELPVLDLGCGRGEWLELLGEHEIAARGVDLNRVMVEKCRDLGLDAEPGDALGFLRAQAAESFRAITAFHVVEHLDRRQLDVFMAEILRCLADGGVMVLETPNPANLLVGAYTFYLDLTHERPLPSDTLRFLAESVGFQHVEVLDLHPYEAEHRFEGSDMAQRLSDLLFGPRDYGLIARKRPG